MTPTLSDIEIYLLKAQPEQVRAWLESSIGPVTETAIKGNSHFWQCESMEMVFTVRAEGNFDSLWIKQNQSPWADDLECARSAHHVLETEIRCAAREWNESESGDQPGWIKLTHGQEKTFDWK